MAFNNGKGKWKKIFFWTVGVGIVSLIGFGIWLAILAIGSYYDKYYEKKNGTKVAKVAKDKPEAKPASPADRQAAAAPEKPKTKEPETVSEDKLAKILETFGAQMQKAHAETLEKTLQAAEERHQQQLEEMQKRFRQEMLSLSARSVKGAASDEKREEKLTITQDEGGERVLETRVDRVEVSATRVHVKDVDEVKVTGNCPPAIITNKADSSHDYRKRVMRDPDYVPSRYDPEPERYARSRPVVDETTWETVNAQEAGRRYHDRRRDFEIGVNTGYNGQPPLYFRFGTHSRSGEESYGARQTGYGRVTHTRSAPSAYPVMWNGSEYVRSYTNHPNRAVAGMWQGVAYALGR